MTGEAKSHIPISVTMPAPTYADRHLVRIAIPLRAPFRPGPRIVILYAEAGSGRAILMNDGLGKYERQRVLRTQRYV